MTNAVSVQDCIAFICETQHKIATEQHLQFIPLAVRAVLSAAVFFCAWHTEPGILQHMAWAGTGAASMMFVGTVAYYWKLTRIYMRGVQILEILHDPNHPQHAMTLERTSMIIQEPQS